MVNFRRCVILTSIDPGALRGDLADRLLLIELNRIPAEERQLDADLIETFQSQRPGLMGALFDLASGVLRELSDVQLDSYPRMADFAKVLAALDRVTGWGALETYMSMASSIASQVVDGDPIAKAILDFVESKGAWCGTAGELLAEISGDDDRHPKGWPATPSAMGYAVRRVAPALRLEGLEVEYGAQLREAGTGKRIIRLAQKKMADRPSQPSHVSHDLASETPVRDARDKCDNGMRTGSSGTHPLDFEERAAIREYDGEMTRQEAERLAMEDLK